jgi:hypothetical protein
MGRGAGGAALLVILLVFIGGCVKPAATKAEASVEKQTLEAEEPGETPTEPAPLRPPPKGPNPFVHGPPELRECLRNRLGKEAFKALAAGTRQPTTEEASLIEGCLRQFPGP